MQVALPENRLPAKLLLNPERPLTDDEYFAFCAANPNLRLERTAHGEIVIVPPAGLESSFRSGKVYAQLERWASKDARGIVSDSSAEFILPNGAALSPDAAWVSNDQLRRLTKQQRRNFPPVCPEFIVEVMSPSDRLRTAKAKMDEWIANGVRLGWLIDADKRTVYVYRPGTPLKKLSGIGRIAAEAPLDGFVLELDEIWAGL